MVEVGEVQVLLSRDVGQVRLGLVNDLRQAQFREVFLVERNKTKMEVTQMAVVSSLLLPLQSHSPASCD